MSNWVRAFNLIDLIYLQHTWSLAIEEQFYLFFPFLLTALLRRLSRPYVILSIAGLSLLSWLWRVVLASQAIMLSRLQLGLDTRLDGLLMGCALALLLASSAFMPLKRMMLSSRSLASLAASGACLMILYWSVVARESNLLTFTIVFFLVSLSACYVIFYIVLIETSPLKRLLEWPPLVFIGKISYGFYLLHWVCFNMLVHLFQVSTITHEVAIVGTGISFATSLFSYRFIERPFLRLKSRFEPHSASPLARSVEDEIIQEQKTI